MLIWTVLVVIGLGLIVVVAVGLRRADLAARSALGRLDRQLRRHAERVPDLVDLVAGVAAHERGIFEEAAEARIEALGAAGSDSVAARAAAGTRLDRAVGDLLAIAEAYPDLTDSSRFQQCRSDVQDTAEALTCALDEYETAARRVPLTRLGRDLRSTRR